MFLYQVFQWFEENHVGILSETVRARQPEGESPKFEKPYISLSGVATAWGHYIELKTLVKLCFIY